MIQGLNAEWRYELVVSETMERIGMITQARGRSVQLVHNRSGGVGFTVPVKDPLFVGVEPIKHGVVVYRNDQPIWSGMIWTMDDAVPGRLTVSAVGWFEILNHRILYKDVTYPRYVDPPLTITGGGIVFDDPVGDPASDSYYPGGLLTQANTQRDTWISEGTTTDQMQRIIAYARGQSIGEAITSLSDTEAGFDFTIDPLTRVMNIKNWDEYRDLSDSVSFGIEWGPNNLQSLSRQLDASTFVSKMTVMGKFGGGLAEDLEAQAEYQLFEEQPQLSEVVDPNILLGYAGGEIFLRSRPRTIYTLTPFPWVEGRTPQPFVDFGIGDKVEFSAKHGDRVRIDKQGVRVFGMTISITEEGNEKVSALQVTPG